MNEELDKQLVEKYAKIFADRHKSMQETCMCWGFDCGPGWYNLIDSLCSTIQHYLDYKPNVHQVEEESWSEDEYYGNSTNYMINYISIDELYNYLIENLLCE